MTYYSQAIRAISVAAQRPAASTFLPALLLPSVPGAIFIVTLAQVLFLSRGTQALFADSDAGWHVRNGEAILRSWSIPFVDSFSFTRENQAWFAWEWLSDILLGAAHQIAGPSGVAVLAALSIALVAWGVARLSLSLGADLFLTAAAAVLLLGTTSIHWLARPHVFSWLLTLLFLSIAEHERRSPSTSRALYATPLLACLWANVHGSFLLGPALLFIYGLGAWKAGRRFAVAGLASLVATFINPYGSRLHAHVLTYLNDGYLMDRISEFRSFNFHSPGALYVELFLLVAVIGAFTLARQKAFGPALLALAMIHFALYSARHLPTAAVIVLPLTVVAVTRELKELPSLRGFFRYSGNLSLMEKRMWGVVPIVLVIAATLAGVNAFAKKNEVGFSAAKFPVGAADFLEKQNVRDRVFAKDQWGGYLIYRFDGRMKVFVDGRSDFYGRAFMDMYSQVAEAKPGWDAVLNQYGIRYVLIPPDHSLVALLTLSRGWNRVYSDRTAVVFTLGGVGGPALGELIRPPAEREPDRAHPQVKAVYQLRRAGGPHAEKRTGN